VSAPEAKAVARRRKTASVARWERMFKVLRYFQQAHGHCDVPPNARRNSLACWLRKQRADARAGRLLPKRFQRLEALGVALGGSHGSRAEHQNRWDELWNSRFAQLIEFKKRFGHCDVPCHWPKDRLLGHWVSNQRSFRNKGWLNQERIARLDKLGFRWIARFNREAPPVSFRTHVRALDQLWDARFAALVRYQKKHGHCHVRPGDGPGRSLSKWVIRCRSEARRGALRADRRRRLDQLGFPWEGGRYHLRVSWETKFAQLVAHKERYGHCDVPCHWPKNRVLGHWVSNQRSFRKKGWLSQERIDRLQQIGFRWCAPFRRD